MEMVEVEIKGKIGLSLNVAEHVLDIPQPLVQT